MLAVLGSLLTSACAPEHEPVDDGVVQTAHLRVTTTTGNPICAGTPVLLESELERIATALELPLWPEDDRLEVRLGEEAVAEVCTQWDPDDIQGCVGDEQGPIVAAVNVAINVPHELVHAIRLKNGVRSTALFEEGLAELVSGSDGFPYSAVSYPRGDPFYGPVEMLQIPREDFAPYYGPAASFVSWLWETEGRAALMAYVNDPAFDGAESAAPLFEQHFGLPLAEAEQAFGVDDRPDPNWGAPCIPERTYSLADGPVELAGELDCSEPTVYGASYGMKLWPMCLEVPQTTRVRISFEADHGRFQVLSREPCDAGPASGEAYRDKNLDAGEVIEEDIVGCRYRMLLGSREPGFPTTPYTIRIEEIGA